VLRFGIMTPLRAASGRLGMKEFGEMKVSSSVRRRCPKCKLVRRRGKVYVICENPRHKQRQG